MGKINKSYFKKILIAMGALFLTLVGNHCGKFNSKDLRLSEDGSRGFVMARFFQDDQIYEKELAFKNLNGYALFEDDIILGKIDDLRSKPLNFVLPSAKTGILDFDQFSGVQSFAFAIEGGRLWTKGIVPYVITAAVSGATGSVKSAMEAITSNTGIKFVERTNEVDYLEFVMSDQANTCGSYVGRQGGAQQVFIQSGGCGLAADVHEILHALGMWHEQSRTDRDTHVEVLYENIQEEYKDQFDIFPGIVLGAYDFNSIMHYGVKFFSKNGNDTIRSRNGEKIERVLPMSGLDASGVQELYRSELSSGGGSQCDPATKGGSCNIANGTGQIEGQTCNTTNQQWTGGVCRVKSCNSGFQPDTARAACVTAGSNNEAPRGNVDTIFGDGILGGWAYDPNDANVSIAIHYYIDGAFAGDNIANKKRTDVNDIVKIPGNHGFEFRIPDSYRNGQTHTIRAYGIDLQGQTNPELGAKSFSLGGQVKPVSASFTTTGGRLKISVLNAGPRGETKVDGSFDWTKFLTDKWSTDGNNYSLDQPLSNYTPGSTIVVRFRNPDVAGEASLTIKIPDGEGSAQKNQAPVGNVDGFFGDGIFYGWAYDPNDPNVSIAIHYYIDGVLAGDNIANKVRTDVNDVVKIPGNHGFEFRIPDSYRNGQTHTIKAYGIDLQGQTNPELGAKSFTLGAQAKPVSASFTTTGGRLKISVLNAGPRGETKIDGSFDWTRFLPEKWSTDGNNYYMDQPLSNYQSGATYVIHFRNPDGGGQTSLTVNIPAQVQPVSASFTTSGGRLKMTVLNAGPRGETKIDGSFDWTRFLPEKWSTDGNNYYMDQPLSNYQSGATYVIRFRNPDVAGEAVITVRIP